IFGLQLGSLLGGAIITETIVAWPGIGRLTLQAIQGRDYPLVQGCVLVIAVGYVTANLLTDLAFRRLDPRIEAAVGEVREQVGGHVTDGDDQNASLHERVIAALDRLQREPADSRPGDDGLGDDRASEQATELQAED